MKSLIRRSATPLAAIIAAFLLLVVLIAIIIVSHAGAINPGQQSGRLITIHDEGTEKVILSDKATIGDALKQAGIVLDSNDAVEPAVTEKLVASQYDVNIYRARPVTVIDGAIRQKVMTPYETAAQIASSAGITLYPEDITTITQSDDIVANGAGLVLAIKRAVPLTLNLYGAPISMRTQAKTVAELLKDKAITLGPNDTISAGLSQSITSGMTIELWHNGSQTVNVQEVVPFDTQTIDDADQPVGYQQITTPGVNGARTVTYQIDMENGKEVSRTQIQAVVTAQPTSQVVVTGVKVALSAGYSADRIAIMTAAGISTNDQGYAAYIIDHENALWCPTRWQGQMVCPSTYVALHSESAQVGYGLCQSTPANKMATAGSDWRTNPVTQMKWCNNYAISRYGSWSTAYYHWATNHNW